MTLLTERHAVSCLGRGPELNWLDARGYEDPGQGFVRHPDRQLIEEGGCAEPVAQFFQGRGERCRVRVHASRDPAQPLRAMIDRVHGGDHGEQYLCGANVACRLLAPDVLLARLQRHAQRGPPGAVFGDADDATGEVALELIPRREEGGVRAAVAERDAEALRVADGDVGAPLTGWGEQRECEQIGRDGHQRARGMRRFAQRAVVADRAVRRRILKKGADHVALLEIESRWVGNHDVDAARGGARAHHRDRLRMTVDVDQVRQLPPPSCFETASVRCIASAAAVPSSSSEALAISSPVRSDTIVWKLSSASSRPCAISAWYGVYGVYQPGFSSTLR